MSRVEAARVHLLARAHGRDFTRDERRLIAHYDRLLAGGSDLPEPGAHLVYRLYDRRGRLLYVGVTDRGPQRLVEHYRIKPWFGMVERVEFERFTTRRRALDRERVLIGRDAPRFNVQHNTRNVGGLL